MKQQLKKWTENNYNRFFILILFIAFAIRLWVFLKTMHQPLWWDAADYLFAAKNWGLGLEIRDIWYYRRGFLWPLICAAFFKLRLGEIGIRFLEVLFSTGIIFVAYLLISQMFNKRLALLTSIGLTASWILYFFTARPLTSIPATFFLLLAVLFFWKGYVKQEGNKFLYLFSLFFALAILTRMQYLLFLLPFFVFVLTKEKFKFIKNKKLWVAFGIFLLILSPQIISYSMHYGNPVTDILSYYFGFGEISKTNQVGERTTSTFFNYILNLPYILAGASSSLVAVANIIFLLFLVGVFYFFIDLFFAPDKILSDIKLQKRIFILVWILTNFLVLGYITDYVEQRYIIASLPFLFLITVYPLHLAGNYFTKKSKLSKRAASLLIILILIILLIPNFLWGINLTEAKATSYMEVKQAGEWVKNNSDPSDIIICDSLPQMAYYSERSTYPFDLSKTGDPAKRTRQDFETFVKNEKPKFLVFSFFEQHPAWVIEYIEENQNTLIPLMGYKQEEQPVLVIYQIKYS